jgi:thiol-disulfide isomerase/thioredoxin
MTNRQTLLCPLIIATIFLVQPTNLVSHVLSAPKSWAEPVVEQPDSLKPGDLAPTFVLRNIATGDPVFLRDYAGKTLRRASKNHVRQVVVLSFWATWCEPCKKEIPILTKMAEEFKDKPVKFFLVNTLEQTKEPTHTEDSVKEILKSRGYTLPCLIDALSMATDAYHIRNLPMLVVIDKNGIIRKIGHGLEEDFEAKMTSLLNDLVQK